MNLKCIKDLSHFLAETFLEKGKPIEIFPELCPPNMNEEITVNCFRLARDLRQKPEVIAKKASEFL
ncbi:unnamed protein product, partial [marine sediment metagenome]